MNEEFQNYLNNFSFLQSLIQFIQLFYFVFFQRNKLYGKKRDNRVNNIKSWNFNDAYKFRSSQSMDSSNINTVTSKYVALVHQRNFSKGGSHVWGDKTHAIRRIKEKETCINPNCLYFQNQCLVQAISSNPGCSRMCKNCGDWIFNCRETCPNPVFQSQRKMGQATINSCHGTRLGGNTEGVHLTNKNGWWEEWTWILIGENKYLWLSFHGTFLRGNENGTVDLAKKPDLWEVWTKEQQGSYHFWRSHHGTYLRAESGGKICLVKSKQQWERWHH